VRGDLLGSFLSNPDPMEDLNSLESSGFFNLPQFDGQLESFLALVSNGTPSPAKTLPPTTYPITLPLPLGYTSGIPEPSALTSQSMVYPSPTETIFSMDCLSPLFPMSPASCMTSSVPSPRLPQEPIKPNLVFISEDPSQANAVEASFVDPTGASKYRCACGKQFQKLCGLRSHIRVHQSKNAYLAYGKDGLTWIGENGQPVIAPPTETERIFVCELCQRNFLRKQDLRRHKVSHTQSQKPFKCEHCGTAFSRSDALFRHLKAKRCRT
jgi:uncharacterized Zn-finger protein